MLGIERFLHILNFCKFLECLKNTFGRFELFEIWGMWKFVNILENGQGFSVLATGNAIWRVQKPTIWDKIPMEEIEERLETSEQ